MEEWWKTPATGVEFVVSEKKVWCCYNISNDCAGMLALEDCYQDDDGQYWNVCRPCQEHEGLTMERLRNKRRTDRE